MYSKMWDEITDPFPNFNGATVEVWECISNFIPRFIMDEITYPCMLRIKNMGVITYPCLNAMVVNWTAVEITVC